MTLTKAIEELLLELNNKDHTLEEIAALKKYQVWLFGIKKTVSNNTERWIPYPEHKPEANTDYLVTIANCETSKASWIEDDFYFAEGDWHNSNKITAWMPKPAPYEGK